MKIFFRGNGYYSIDQCWDIQALTGGDFVLQEKESELFHRLHPNKCLHLLSPGSTLPNLQGVVIDTMAGPTFTNNPFVRNILCYHGAAWGHILGPSHTSYNDQPYPTNEYFFDYFFVSGPRDVLKYRWHFNLSEQDIQRRCIPTGLLRSDQILKKQFSQKTVRKKLGIEGDRPVILFAPTGQFASGSLLTHGPSLCEQLNDTCTVLVRGHPAFPEPIAELKALVEEREYENIHFINGSVMGIIENMAAADLLISDQSAVIMDWLFFSRPVIFTNSPLVHHVRGEEWSTGDRFDVQRCGPRYVPRLNNLAEMVHTCLDNNPYAQAIEDYREDCFYFNDGKACERAAEFISDLASTFPRYDSRKMNVKFEYVDQAEKMDLLFDFQTAEEWAILMPLFTAIQKSCPHVRCHTIYRNTLTKDILPLLKILERKGIPIYNSTSDIAAPAIVTVNTPTTDYSENYVVGTIMADEDTQSSSMKTNGARPADFAFVQPTQPPRSIPNFDSNCIIETETAETILKVLHLAPLHSRLLDGQGELICKQ